jgi:hypothetical protein
MVVTREAATWSAGVCARDTRLTALLGARAPLAPTQVVARRLAEEEMASVPAPREKGRAAAVQRAPRAAGAATMSAGAQRRPVVAAVGLRVAMQEGVAEAGVAATLDIRLSRRSNSSSSSSSSEAHGRQPAVSPRRTSRQGSR